MSAQIHQSALKSDTVNSTVQQLLSLFLARNGVEGEDHTVFLEDDCCQAGKVSQWHLSSSPGSVQGAPSPPECTAPAQPSAQSPCALLLQPMCSKHHSVWGCEKLTHSSSPNSPVSPCLFPFHRENSHQAQQLWQPQPMDTMGVTKVLSTGAPALLSLHCHLISTTNFYFQGKKLNWQSKPFVKHKARNNTFSFKQFFTASSLQIFALSLQKIRKKFSVYSISECHNLQKNK